ncbi:MAG TPA: DUF2797 domain-containing protein [Kineosporiaceae bacterium]
MTMGPPLPSFVCHGVTWSTGVPTLLLADPTGPSLRHHDLLGADLAWRVTAEESYCTGRYGFVDTHRVEPLPCPRHARAARSGQCPTCQAADDFRFAHQAHRGGPVPAALTAYLAQPHWLYLATFAAATTKVGTAAEPRLRSRLDEQGPHQATYLTRAADGRTVRLLEDALSTDLGIAQTVRRTVKIDALARSDRTPRPGEHEQVVSRALDLLTGWDIATDPRPWIPPPSAAALTAPETHRQRAIYPHDVRHATHGLHIDACLGSCVLARLLDHDDSGHYVVDLALLKGRAIALGAYTSPPTPTQDLLF